MILVFKGSGYDYEQWEGGAEPRTDELLQNTIRKVRRRGRRHVTVKWY